MKNTTKKTYTDLIKLNTFEKRFEYLRLKGKVGKETFGVDRYLNQLLYSSTNWKQFRNRIILRDNGCDLAFPDYEIQDRIYIHHINPITIEDVENNSPSIFDPDNVVCCSFDVHNAIHFNKDLLGLRTVIPVERKPNDTCLWK